MSKQVALPTEVSMTSAVLRRQCRFRSPHEKAEFVANAFARLVRPGSTVLDIGCRDAFLKTLLPRGVVYVGADISGNANLILDAERGLPFKSGSFDLVLALDVLEHLNELHYIAAELCRVSRDWVLIVLPNMFEYFNRALFLFGTLSTTKYKLVADRPEDRHRWLFSYNEARAFCHELARRQHYGVAVDFAYYPAFRRFPFRQITGLTRSLGLRPNLFARSYWCLLQKGAARMRNPSRGDRVGYQR